MQQINRLPEKKTSKTGPGPTTLHQKQCNWDCRGCNPTLRLEMPRLHTETTTDRPEITKTKLTPIPEVFWQKLPEISMETSILGNFNNYDTTETSQSIHMAELKQRNDVESQILPLRKTSFQKSGSHTEPFRENETSIKPVLCSTTPRTVKLKPKEQITTSAPVLVEMEIMLPIQ